MDKIKIYKELKEEYKEFSWFVDAYLDYEKDWGIVIVILIASYKEAKFNFKHMYNNVRTFVKIDQTVQCLNSLWK